MLGIAPTDLVVRVSENSLQASLDFTTNSWQAITVLSPTGEELAVTLDTILTGPLRSLYSFLTDVDGIYTIKKADASFCIPILGRLYACRTKLLLTTPSCDCKVELDKVLRTLDVLLRCIVALANAGDSVQAQQLYTLAATLCACHA